MLDVVPGVQEAAILLSPLQPLALDEDVSLWSGCSGRHEISKSLEACKQLPTSGKRLLVLWVPNDLCCQEATRYASDIATAADLVILVGDEPVVVADAVALTHVRGEDDPRRAIVASLQLLGRGESLVLLGPDEASLTQMRSAARAGCRWRKSWDEAEGGEFHQAPRQAIYPAKEDTGA